MTANYDIPNLNGTESKKMINVPFSDVDDLPYRNRQDPNFIASITNMMQVPASITLSSDSSQRRQIPGFYEHATFPMDIPEKLTADGILNGRPDLVSSPNSEFNDENHINDTTATPPSTPTRGLALEKQIEDDFGRTPQISADLYQRMRPRRSSIEVDLHAEIRMLRDKLNYLENEVQVNSRSCKLFYAILCGYVLLKSFSWLVNK